jgi:predicted nucleic acid-binding protein
MADAITHLFWDTCVFCALLYDQQQSHDINSIQQYIQEAKDGKHRIYTSSLVFAEIVPSYLKNGSFQEFIEDMQGATVIIDASTNVMNRAGILRDLPYKKEKSTNRRLATADAIILSSCLFLKDELGVTVAHFHTFDDGKHRNRETGNKMVPLLSYQEWCEGFTTDQLKIAHPLISLSRVKPIHPSPGLFNGAPKKPGT